MRIDGCEGPDPEVQVAWKFRKRFFYRQDESRVYYDQRHEKKFVVPPRSKERRRVIVLDDTLCQILSRAAAREFGRRYALERECALRLGQTDYRRLYEIIPEGECLCDLVLLRELDPDLLQNREVVTLVNKAKPQPQPKQAVLRFKYASRRKTGVLPLRSLLAYGLIVQKDHYQITVKERERDAIKHQFETAVADKGIIHWMERG